MQLNFLMIILQWYLKQYMKQSEELGILTPKQIFQRLLIVLAQVKARNNSKYLLNEIR